MLNAASVLPRSEPTAWISSLRPPRNRLDPFTPHGLFCEQELSNTGQIVDSAVILLTNKECPWRCLMCDLWKNTLTHSVPLGAIPKQIDYALARLDTKPEQLKLYNSGSFFDPGAIPTEDYPAIARSISFAKHVIVESHPRLVGKNTLRLRDALVGSLEVAIGLETVNPKVLPRLNKKFDLDQFAAAAEFLRNERILLRAFVLVKPPFMEEEEALEWAVKSAEFAFACGATAVSLIPTRGGNGAMERLEEAGEFSAPRLSVLENAQELALNSSTGGRVFADTWDLEKFARCSVCFEQRRLRLKTVNLSQQILPAIVCPACGGA